MSSKEERLPLGAVRTAKGDVVVPASQRADGSTRKPIRIRQGYVPQDETPKYKTVAQRRREQEAKRVTEGKAGDGDIVDGLRMDKLSLGQKKKMPLARERPRTAEDRARREEEGRSEPVKEAKPAALQETNEDQQQLKRQLTKINKHLKEIVKLEEASTLSPQQKQKLDRKATLQQERNDIIAELNGATFIRTSASKTGGTRPKVTISL